MSETKVVGPCLVWQLKWGEGAWPPCYPPPPHQWLRLFPANIHLFKVNNRTIEALEKCVKYVQSFKVNIKNMTKYKCHDVVLVFLL